MIIKAFKTQQYKVLLIYSIPISIIPVVVLFIKFSLQSRYYFRMTFLFVSAIFIYLFVLIYLYYLVVWEEQSVVRKVSLAKTTHLKTAVFVKPYKYKYEHNK